MHMLRSIALTAETTAGNSCRQLVCGLQALANPKRISLELLKHMLTTVLACLPVATEHLIVTFETVSSPPVCQSWLLVLGHNYVG